MRLPDIDKNQAAENAHDTRLPEAQAHSEEAAEAKELEAGQSEANPGSGSGTDPHMTSVNPVAALSIGSADEDIIAALTNIGHLGNAAQACEELLSILGVLAVGMSPDVAQALIAMLDEVADPGLQSLMVNSPQIYRENPTVRVNLRERLWGHPTYGRFVLMQESGIADSEALDCLRQQVMLGSPSPEAGLKNYLNVAGNLLHYVDDTLLPVLESDLRRCKQLFVPAYHFELPAFMAEDVFEKLAPDRQALYMDVVGRHP